VTAANLHTSGTVEWKQNAICAVPAGSKKSADFELAMRKTSVMDWITLIVFDQREWLRLESFGP